jgi:hypothetical protein
MSFLRRQDTSAEILHFAQKWLGKEIEITKAKFDDECEFFGSLIICKFLSVSQRLGSHPFYIYAQALLQIFHRLGLLGVLISLAF